MLAIVITCGIIGACCFSCSAYLTNDTRLRFLWISAVMFNVALVFAALLIASFIR